MNWARSFVQLGNDRLRQEKLRIDLNALGINTLHEDIHKSIKAAIKNFDANLKDNKVEDEDTVHTLKDKCIEQSRHYLSLLERDAQRAGDEALKNEINTLASNLPQKITDPNLNLPEVVEQFSKRLKQAENQNMNKHREPVR